MALIPFKPKMLLPLGLGDGLGTLNAFANFNASTMKKAAIFTVPKSGTLDKCEFRTADVVSLNAGSVIRISFQDVSTSTTTAPDETQDQYRDIAAGAFAINTWIAPGLMTSDGTDTGAKRTVTKGDLLAVVWEFQTFNTGDNCKIANQIIGAPLGHSFPSSLTKTSGTWTVEASFNIALKYSDGSYEVPNPRWVPASAVNNPNFNSGSTPDERGLLFQVPLPYEVSALYFHGFPANASGDYQLVLYDSGSSVVASATVDATITGRSGRSAYHVLSSRPVLTPNSDYRMIVKPTTANGVTMIDFDFASEAIKNAVADSTWKYTQRTDAGAWTDTATKLPWATGIQLSGLSL